MPTKYVVGLCGVVLLVAFLFMNPREFMFRIPCIIIMVLGGVFLIGIIRAGNNTKRVDGIGGISRVSEAEVDKNESSK